ncbi:MAG: glycosyltransferase [Phycisphaerae bacterium]|nr:glycosyltransferase [Phycisphaerae bacterium]
MSVSEIVCGVVLLLLTLAPALFAWQTYLLLWASRSGTARQPDAHSEAELPSVTTQIPLFNEPMVARRVIEAVAAIDYPADRHQIQILDDSSDETRHLVDETAARLRARGVDVAVVRRADRAGYKAGALQAGLAHARGEFIAVFDADFVPPARFLKSMVPAFMRDPRAACVQTRWEHLNRTENALTRAVALGMDGHFAAEQPGRAALGWALNFNGTAGIWRRAAIDDPRVGGWHGDTLTEDLDLSYRAQLAGWRIVYQPEPACPAEIPADVASLKAQQRRWATGSIQCAMKLAPAVWGSDWPLAKKLAATAHLFGYSVSLWMLLMALIGRTCLAGVDPELARRATLLATVVILTSSIAPTIAYAVCQHRLRGRWPHLGDLVALLLLGLGLSVNNAFAVLRGVWLRGGEFVRTPKTGSATGQKRLRGALPVASSSLWFAELALAAWCVWQWWWFLPVDGPIANAFLLLFAAGLFWVGGAGATAWVRAMLGASHTQPEQHPAELPVGSAAT